jgi:hypothetical protein
MLTTAAWEFAIIGQDEARRAQVHWLPGRRLPEELIPTAMRLGYTASELDTYSIGELVDDLVLANAVYLRGALVLPDEQGHPAALFGKPLVKSGSEPGRTSD